MEDINQRVLEFVTDGQVVGLGTGQAATAFIHSLGARVQKGLRLLAVPTSEVSAALARQLGIPLTSLDENPQIDVTVDGADEVDPQLDLIKGLGGALVREKIVAAASKQLVILVGSEKLVPILGTRGILPVEVLPFAFGFCRHRLLQLGCDPSPRLKDGHLFQTDNGNRILDCRISPLEDPPALERSIRAIPGVIGSGLFLGMAHRVLVQEGEQVKVLQRLTSPESC